MQGLHRRVSRCDLCRQDFRVSICLIIDYYRTTGKVKVKVKVTVQYTLRGTEV